MSTENSVSTYLLDDPICSSDSVWYRENDSLSISDVLDAEASSTHTHDYAASDHTHTEYAALVHEHSGYASSTHEHSEYSSSDHNHDEVYSALSHTHDTEYMAKALQMMSDDGGVKYTYSAASAVNMLTTLAAFDVGMHTCYFAAGLEDNPNSSEAFRVFIHKTGSTVGWLYAFGSGGSVYSNYQYGTTSFRGWRTIFEASPTALWTGAQYINGSQTVTPSKALSACRNGWMLVWSDYTPSTSTAGDGDVCTSFIPKKHCTGSNWSGQSYLTVIPVNMDSSSDSITCKRLYVYDSYFTGHDANGVDPRTDAVLRAVYEF